MPMIIKNYTISHSVSTSFQSDGVTTGNKVWSQPGVKAEIMLLPKGEWQVPNKPRRAHVSLQIEIDRVPSEAVADIEGWLRAELVSMLEDDEPMA